MIWKTSLLTNALVVLMLFCTGCGVYSFTGANISPDVKTMSFQTFQNQSGQGPSNLSQTFTEQFRDYFQRNTSLNAIRDNGDLQFSGTITGYETGPAAITQANNGSSVSQINRLTMRVLVRFTNTKQPDQSFEQTFSYFADYEPTQTLQQVESRLIAQISEQIIVDAFNRSVANW
jgi:hypothetical protein